jgi:hypothetical protein
LCIYLFFKICKRRHAPENNVQYVERYSVTKEEEEVDKTFTLPIYYSLFHDKNLTVTTLFYSQLLYEIISLQKFAVSKKRTFTYTYPVFLCFFLSATAFLVPATGSCARIPGVFIDNRERMCLFNTKLVFNNCRQSLFM